MSFQMHLWIAGLVCQQSWRGINVLRGAGRGTHVVSLPCCPATIRPGARAALQAMVRQVAAGSPLRQEVGNDH